MALRHSLLVIVLGTASCAVQSLGGTEWAEVTEDDGATECPDTIRFESVRYVYLNDCYAPGQDGVVESGSYELRRGKLRLYDRTITSVGSRLGSNADPLLVTVTSAGNGRHVLVAGSTQIAFEKR